MAVRKRGSASDDRQGGFFAPPADPAPAAATMDALIAPSPAVVDRIVARLNDLTFDAAMTGIVIGTPSPCVTCKKHWLAGAGRTCYWCQQRLLDAAPSA